MPRDLVLTDPYEISLTVPGYFRLDPFLAANFAHRQVTMLVRRASAIILRAEFGERLSVVGRGDIGQVVALLERNAGRLGKLEFALLPHGIEEAYPGHVERTLGLAEIGAWEWMSCYTPPPYQEGEERCRILGDEDRGEIAELLKNANPIATTSPDDERFRWWGYRDESGTLLSVCAMKVPEAGRQGLHLASFGTRPDARRRGIGRAMMAVMTRWGITHHGYVHYGVWTDNQAAIQLYRRLGYSIGAAVQMYRRPRRR